MNLTKTKCIIIPFLFLFCSVLQSQSFDGAWETVLQNEAGVDTHYVTIFSYGFVSEAFFDKETGKFGGTWGGSFNTNNATFNHTYEFATFDPSLVGTSESTEFEFIDGQLHMADKVWTRIDDGGPGELNGAWLISGRKRGGEMRQMDTSRPRKTMKILSGTRFQWIAYNTETKEFMGTGGGTYTTKNGKYTELIGFFSRDDSRVGASLEFDYEIKDGDWHHSGLSSKGMPIYEIWSKRTLSE
ncbi:membrane or secreted protein [Muricauda sp. JGD-17]|uniref:Membrane or secreted protein n=1 Tax=Flagellimonas ochracea TaxID=2696472 RepID=A0A964TE85_9FLAO|nr:membrane or secreted protein [Allomuricauda ochracea]NAY91861.1 membrane or secreted protein [Allomuricauda ochracea]